VTLAWTAAPDAAGYNIYRSTTSGAEGAVPYATGVHGASFTDASALNGTTYFYTVTAVNNAGESAQSIEVFATPAALPQQAPGVVSAVYAGGEELVYVVYPDTSLWLFEGNQQPQELATGILYVSAFVKPNGVVGADVVYADHTCYYFDETGAHYLGNNVLAASTAFTPTGLFVAEVVYTDHSLYQFDSTGVHELGTDVQAVSVAVSAQNQMVLDVVYTDGTLYQTDSAGRRQIDSNVLSVNLSFDQAAQLVTEEVYTNLDVYQTDSQGKFFIAQL
jgi:hypothetical protein